VDATDYGPVPADAGTWAGCRLDEQPAVRLGAAGRGDLETIGSTDAAGPLMHFRGRYRLT
jgi:hypothetical protein